MKAILALIFVAAITVGLVGTAYAHKSEVIGDYKIGVGWKNEPPVVGIDNSIEVVITKATDFDKMNAKNSKSMKHDEMKHDDEERAHDEMKHDEKMSKPGEGVSGLAKSLEAMITLGEQKTHLLLEESEIPGVYHAKYTPESTGHPLVDLSGEIGHTSIEFTFHPEKVESISVLAPLKQIKAGVTADKVECKSGMERAIKASTGEPVCVKHDTVEKLVQIGWAVI